MFLPQARPAVIGTLSQLPPWLLGLGEMPFAFRVPVWTTRFDFAEVGVWITLNGLFLIGALFVP
jgi:hypothetical protein